MVKRFLILVLISLEISYYCLPQNNMGLDSLKEILSYEKDTIKKAEIMLKLADNLMEREPNTALAFINNSLLLLKQKPNKELLAKTYFHLGDIYYLLNQYDTAIFFFHKALDYSLELKRNKDIASCYNGLGNVAYYKYNLHEALVSYQKSIEYLKKEPGLEAEIANGWHNIGLIHDENKNYDKALQYYFRALKVFKKKNVKKWLINTYNSIGSTYVVVNQYDSALYYFNLALENIDKKNNLVDLEMVYSNLGIVYHLKNEIELSLGYFVKAETLAKKLNDNIGLAEIYSGLAAIFYNRKNFHKSIAYCLKARHFSQISHSAIYLKDIYKYLKSNYEAINEYKTALAYADSLITINDSLFTIEKNREIAKTESLYQDKQRQLIIKNLEKEKALSQEKSKKQRLFLIAVIVGFLIISSFLIFIVRLLRKNQRTNKFLSSKNMEILAQRDEIEGQRDLVMTQKGKIEIINQNIAKSIDYAKRIQQSILPDQTILSDFISDAFVFFKPRDVVSGDFYWWTHMKMDNELVIAVSDCTGHGVPGAFMSMLGISFLREIVTKEYVSHPGVILRKLRKEIIHALKQKDEYGGQKDGMDMALVSINLDTLKLQFAGANNPLYIIKPVIKNRHREDAVRGDLSNESTTNNQQIPTLTAVAQNDDYKFYEIKPDKMPIAIYERMDKFTNHKIQLQKGDRLYLFSDGFADQFGGPKGKKFKYKPFKQLLLDNAGKPMEEQKNILEKVFTGWKGENEQVDDVTIVGIKI